MAVNVVTRSSDYTGKVVQTLEEGKPIGKVTDVVFNNDKNRLTGLIIGDKEKQDSAGFLFSDIKEIVEDTIFVNENNVKKLDEVFELEKSNGEGKEAFVGTNVTDENGDQLGTLTDLYFDADTGELRDIEIETGDGNKRRVPTDKVSQLSSEKVVILSAQQDNSKSNNQQVDVVSGSSKQNKDQQGKRRGNEEGIEGKLQNASDKISNKAQKAVDKITS